MYAMWRERPENIWSRKLMNALGWVFSWKEYKLTYSGFWGYRIRPARFSSPGIYRHLQYQAYKCNIFLTYIGVIILCCVGLYDLDWTTQLYTMMIEMIVICLIMILLGYYEQKKQETDYLEDKKWTFGSGGAKGFNVMS